jgi:hypothetical protein
MNMTTPLDPNWDAGDRDAGDRAAGNRAAGADRSAPEAGGASRPDPFYRDSVAGPAGPLGQAAAGGGGGPAPAAEVAWEGPTQAGRRTYPIADLDVRVRSIKGVEPPTNQPWYGIGFWAAFKRALAKGATFSGRASRG